MLALPTSGVRPSVAKHNSDLDVATDWLELVSLLTPGGWSIPDIVDVLIEGGIYVDQDFASEFVESMIAEVRRRVSTMAGSHPLMIDPSSRVVAIEGRPFTGLLFCLLLSVGNSYSGWSDQFNNNYVQQGTLFERLTVDALRASFPGWEVLPTGWGDGQQIPLPDLVNALAEATREDVIPGWQNWVAAQGKDVGLDVAVVRRFADGAGGLPVMMWQCASGANWKSKLSSPDTKAWNRLVTLTHTPLRGLTTPVAIPLEEVKARRNTSHGVLLDRYRLLPPSSEADWLAATTKDDVDVWNAARCTWLVTHYPLS